MPRRRRRCCRRLRAPFPAAGNGESLAAAAARFERWPPPVPGASGLRDRRHRGKGGPGTRRRRGGFRPLTPRRDGLPPAAGPLPAPARAWPAPPLPVGPPPGGSAGGHGAIQALGTDGAGAVRVAAVAPHRPFVESRVEKCFAAGVHRRLRGGLPRNAPSSKARGWPRWCRAGIVPHSPAGAPGIWRL